MLLPRRSRLKRVSYFLNRVFLESLARKCRETGALLIIDDVQTGFAGQESCFNIVPDILVLAALGGEMPLGAFISSREIMGTLASQPELGHITTFEGTPFVARLPLQVLRLS